MPVKHTTAWRERGENDGLIDVPQRVIAHAVATQQFQGMQRLRTLANDVADMLAGGQMIRHSHAKHLDRGHAANVQHLWRQTFSVLALAVSEYNLGLLSLRLLFCAKQSTLFSSADLELALAAGITM